ncbi:MAG TPA: hypothetical protein VNZ86_05875, partial [Bacteroidia bacterium]|nr:hypothetical protein [Bacteroidia bacterium]
DFGHRSEFLELGFAFRTSYVNFTDYSNSSKNITYHSLDDVYLEPTAFVRAGSKYVKGSFQLGLSLRGDGLSQTSPKFLSNPFYCSVGIYVTLNRHWK